MTRRRLRELGVLQLLVLLTLVAEPVADGIHHLLQPHYWCITHHAFEHARATVAELEGHPFELPPNTLGSDRDRTGGQHELCHQSFSTHQRTRPSASASVEALVLSGSVTRPRLDFVPPQVPPLARAPKTAPPLS